MTRLPWPLVFQVIGVIAAIWLVVHAWPICLLAFTALILAAAILPVADLGERHRVPRGVTVMAVYLGGAAVLALLGRLLWPALTEQWGQFLEQLPKLIENVRRWLGNLDTFLLRWGNELPQPKAENLQTIFGVLLANTLHVTAGVLGFVFGVLSIIVIAAYLVIDADRIGKTLLALLPPGHRKQARDLSSAALERIGGYVRGQILSSLCVGAVLAIGMAVLGVPYALLIGALAAAMNVVPFVGSILAAVLGALSALNQSLGLALATGLLFWGTNFLEAKLLAPHFVGRATGLHPLAVLVALFAGAHLAGLIGALVAVPFLAAVWEIVGTLYLDRDAIQPHSEKNTHTKAPRNTASSVSLGGIRDGLSEGP